MKAPKSAGRVAWVIAIASTRAWAQAGDDQAAAEALFEQGKKLLVSGQYSDACAKFEASQAMDAGIGTLLYLGDCYEKLGRSASAWAAFREAESLAAAAGQTQRERVARARVRVLEMQLVRLTIEVGPANAELPGFELLRDGVPIPKAAFGVAMPLDPGPHTIVATAPDKRPYSEVVTLGRDSLSLIVPALADAPAEAGELEAAPTPIDRSRPQAAPAAPARRTPTPPGAKAQPPRGRTQRALAYTTGLVGLGGLAVGGYFGWRALDRNARSKRECRPDDASLCNARGVELRHDARSAATLSTIGFAAGGALFATGLVLLVTAPRRAERLTSLSLSTSLGAAGPMVEVGGQW